MAGFDIDFGALRPANPFAAYAQGQEVGQQQRQQQAQREAGNVFATDPEKAAQILMGSGDLKAGLAVRDYATKRQEEATRKAALARAGGGDLAGAQADALNAGDVETYNDIAKMDEAQRARSKENAEAMATYIYPKLAALKNGQVTPEQIKAQILADRQQIAGWGFTEQQIDGFQPSVESLTGLVSVGMKLSDLLEQAEKDRNFGLKEKQFDESARHNRATESTSRGQLGVAQGRLGLGREQHRARLAAGGYGTPGVGGGGLSDNDVEID